MATSTVDPLIPILSEELQTAALSLLPTSQSCVADMSQAVFEQMGLTQEAHRRRFRTCRLTGEDHPLPARQLSGRGRGGHTGGGSPGRKSKGGRATPATWKLPPQEISHWSILLMTLCAQPLTK